MFSIKHIYILFFCFVFALNVTAQDKNKAIALKYVLQSIEKKHAVTFNYIENDIVNISIIPPVSSLSLAEKLYYLQKRDCLKIYLEVEVLELDSIVANHFLASGISKSIDGTFVIKPKKLGIL